MPRGVPGKYPSPDEVDHVRDDQSITFCVTPNGGVAILDGLCFDASQDYATDSLAHTRLPFTEWLRLSMELQWQAFFNIGNEKKMPGSSRRNSSLS